MAKRQVVVCESDLSGDEFEEGNGGSTISFSLHGTDYEIDVTDAEGTIFTALFDKYIEAGREVKKGGNVPLFSKPGGGADGRRKYGTGPTKKGTAHIRDFIKEVLGKSISDRGRIPIDLMEQYDDWKRRNGGADYEAGSHNSRSAATASQIAGEQTIPGTEKMVEKPEKADDAIIPDVLPEPAADANAEPTVAELLALYNEKEGKKLKRLSGLQEQTAMKYWTARHMAARTPASV